MPTPPSFSSGGSAKMDPTGSTPTTCRSADTIRLLLLLVQYESSPTPLHPSSSPSSPHLSSHSSFLPPFHFPYMYLPTPSSSLFTRLPSLPLSSFSPFFLSYTPSSLPSPSPPSLLLFFFSSPSSSPFPLLSLTPHLHIRHFFLELATDASNSSSSSRPHHHHVQLPSTLVNNLLCCTIIVC